MKNAGKYLDRSLEVLFHIIITAVLVFLIIGVATFPSEQQSDLYECELFDIDWYQVLSDGSKRQITVPGKYEVPNGETMTITGILPDTLDVKRTPWLCFHSSLQDMQIYIDGELRGSYSTKDTRLWGKNSVSAYYFVHLEASDIGKVINFSFTTDSQYSGVIRQIYAGTVFGMYMQFAKNNAFEVLSALFVLVLSIVTIIVSEFVQIKMHKKIYLGYLGWTELILSIWVLSESPMRQLYFNNMSLAGYMTHFAVFLGALPVILFIDYVQKRRYKLVYRILLLAEIPFSIIASILEMREIAQFSTLFNVAIVLHLISILAIGVTYVLDIKQGYAKEYVLVSIGFLGFVAGAVSQLIMYKQKNVVFHGGFLCVGAVFWLVMSVFSTIRDYFELEKENMENRIRAKKLTWQAMETLVQTIEAKDTYTKGHSARVALYSALLAEKMGLSKEKQSEIYYMGMLHDIGKIGIADNIINKPGRLTDEEDEIIKTHPNIGYSILKNMNEIKDIEYGAKWHHERYDGKGYPDGLSGEEIPVYARIIAVADVYDAMTSNRSYRDVMPQNEVRAEIERVRGTQLDPDIAACMLQLIDEDQEYRLRQVDTDSESQAKIPK